MLFQLGSDAHREASQWGWGMGRVSESGAKNGRIQAGTSLNAARYGSDPTCTRTASESMEWRLWASHVDM